MSSGGTAPPASTSGGTACTGATTLEQELTPLSPATSGTYAEKSLGTLSPNAEAVWYGESCKAALCETALHHGSLRS